MGPLRPPAPRTDRMGLLCRALDAATAPGWDDFVRAMPGGTFFHLAAWREVIARAFGHRTYYVPDDPRRRHHRRLAARAYEDPPVRQLAGLQPVRRLRRAARRRSREHHRSARVCREVDVASRRRRRRIPLSRSLREQLAGRAGPLRDLPQIHFCRGRGQHAGDPTQAARHGAQGDPEWPCLRGVDRSGRPVPSYLCRERPQPRHAGVLARLFPLAAGDLPRLLRHCHGAGRGAPDRRRAEFLFSRRGAAGTMAAERRWHAAAPQTISCIGR